MAAAGNVQSLLLSIWYDLSDVKLAEALDDRASFRHFCGFSASEATPERTAFIRFRRLLVAYKLDRALFETVTAQLKSRAVTVKTGTLVDATIIASASEGNVDAHWVKHKGKRAVHGFKAHVGADADTAKRSYGLRRMRWRGLAEAAAQVHLIAIAYNLKRTMNIITAAA